MRKEIVDIDDGKPSARAQKLLCGGRKKGLVGGLNGIGLYTTKYKTMVLVLQ